MDEMSRNMIIASIGLVLASMYGGDALGSWFYAEGERTQNDGDSTEGNVNFNLEGYKYEWKISGHNDDSGGEKLDYDDNNCKLDSSQYTNESNNSGDCDELYDLMQGKIKNLLFVVILAGFAALYFLNEGDREKGAMACLVMGGAGLLAAVMFATFFPDALDDDTEAFETIDEDPALFGDNDDFESDSSWETEVNWRPGFAFALVGLSGLVGMAVYFEVKS
jgi:hypothetical protein